MKPKIKRNRDADEFENLDYIINSNIKHKLTKRVRKENKQNVRKIKTSKRDD